MAFRTFSRREFAVSSALSIAALSRPHAGPALARAASAELPELAIVAKDFSFEMPATIASGFTAVTLENQGTVDHQAIFIRLDDDKTLDDVKAAETPLDLSKLGECLGGPVVSAGASHLTVIDFPPGAYAVVCVIVIPDGIAHYHKGMIAPLEVTAGETAGNPPAADVTVELMEMMFHELPDVLPAGSTVWEIRNAGSTIHEMVVFKLDDSLAGIGADQFLAMLLGPPPVATPGAAPAGPPPFTTVGATAFMSSGRAIYTTLDLTAGSYLAICFWIDVWGGESHAELGMVHDFTVQ